MQPNHIAIIPDGNRRWAQKRGLKPWFGHRVGAKNLEKIIDQALKFDIKYLTFWASSKDNIVKRDKTEINFLFRLYSLYFKKFLNSKKINQNKIQINIIGEWKNLLPKNLVELFEKIIEKTKNYNKRFLTFLIAYDGKEEMKQGMEKIIKSEKEKITLENIKSSLATGFLPEVDLLIRTGKEPHLSSGFMMWLISDSQLYFSEKLWPEFSPEDFQLTIEEYKKRRRSLGK
ncbi:MAG: di-trans,poly-cis-decaprenylcistransferase [Parcubacteria group bacterium]|nr:di-trans,poly-cis-decaprenylcistransferase [Parcubacteria group bacterium]